MWTTVLNKSDSVVSIWVNGLKVPLTDSDCYHRSLTIIWKGSLQRNMNIYLFLYLSHGLFGIVSYQVSFKDKFVYWSNSKLTAIKKLFIHSAIGLLNAPYSAFLAPWCICLFACTVVVCYCGSVYKMLATNCPPVGLNTVALHYNYNFNIQIYRSIFVKPQIHSTTFQGYCQTEISVFAAGWIWGSQLVRPKL